jgi:hypothetical protein
LVETVVRVRAGRKFLRGGHKTTLKLSKTHGETVGEDEILFKN